MSGKDMRDKLQSMWPGLKCLFMSGHDKDIFGAQGVLASGLPFLQKPFTRREVAGMMRDLLDNEQP